MLERSALSRREWLRTLAATGAAVGVSWPALGQDEVVVPFIDMPLAPPGAALRQPPSLASFLTPNDEFFSVQHYNIPTVDATTYRLKIGGLVERPLELSLADLRRRPRVEQTVGFECSGNNNARGNPLMGNARWAGTSLSAIMKDAGVRDTGREVVFFGADMGKEEIVHGGAPVAVEQHFGRSLETAEAMRPDVMLAYEMNGAPLPQGHGAPLRLIVPGWYGVAQVKWLTRVHVQDARFMGRFMARDYVTLRGESTEGETTWNETSVGRIRLKSAIGRVTLRGTTCTITGFAFSDGTPISSVEVRIDDGPWRPATWAPENTAYSWRLFRYTWPGATPGEHTVVSRVTDARGQVQPTQDDPEKKTRWENNGQFVRRIRISA